MSTTLTILGCGSSGGVPRVGQGWGACDPAEPKNRRRRCSVLVERVGEGGTTTLLVDTSPDLREQLIGANVTRLDGVLMTHDHADHTHGIDDLRPLVIMQRKRITIHADSVTTETMISRFGYCFAAPAGSDYPPILDLSLLEPLVPMSVDGPGGAIAVLPIRLRHGKTDALGLRIGNTAYTPDLNDIYPESIAALSDLDLWIVDALRPTPHPTHFSLQEALQWIDRLKPKRAILTNLHTDLDYGLLVRSLPPHIVPAFDGMTVAL
ncbi:MAG: MBL fold metallo-hydrolase [Beijerinckiaceae bacterium]